MIVSGTPNLKAYYTLAKPGIIKGNLVTATGGFLFGAILRVDFLLLLATLAGTALVIGSGCVFNNYLDRDIDAVMKRTKQRALVTGDIPTKYALSYASSLGILGVIVLMSFTNTLTTVLGLIGFIGYVTLYTFAKRVTVHSTLLGTIPGAIPPVAGYTAATDRLDISALLLFLILVFWQMAHFYSIAIFRKKEYAAAKLPIMPVKYGVWATKVQIFIYCGLFLLAIVALAKFSYAGIFFLAVMVPLALWWLLNAFNGLWGDDDIAWARKMFFMSLFVIVAFSGMLSLNAWLP